MTTVILVNVFTFNGAGGNPCPVVLDAGGMTDVEMQGVAKRYGHESGFVVPSTDNDHDFCFRFFVPNHEMEMCGHATIGALSLLAQNHRVSSDTVRVSTSSGPVTGYIGSTQGGLPTVEITQPVGRLDHLHGGDADQVLKVLGLAPHDLDDRPLYNAATSRVKTLVPVKDAARLNAISIDTAAVKVVCEHIGSTGIYPYTVVDRNDRIFEARQFPRASGYPEDAATGIAAAALAFGLLADGFIANNRPARIYQGRAMARLSEINVRIEFSGIDAIGCRVGGAVSFAE